MSCPPDHVPACTLRDMRARVRDRLRRLHRRAPTGREVDDEMLNQLARQPDLLAHGYFEAQARQRRRAAA